MKLISNFKDAPYGEAIKVGPDPGWARGLLISLERIQTPYLIYAQEDYWIKSPVNTDNIRSYAGLLADDRADYIRLRPSPGPDHPLPGDTRLGVISPNAHYRASLQMALWRKPVLQALIVPTESAWRFEVAASARSACYGPRFLCVTSVADGVDHLISAVVSGEWTQAAKDYIRREGLAIDFAALPRKPLLRLWYDHARRYAYRWKKRILGKRVY
jgi:hypothetical protein